MDLSQYLAMPNEKPLDHICPDGGFCAIFRTIACIGDSLSSGEFESTDESGTKRGYHDYFTYSWGQYIARMTGATVYNFSKGGMTARQYLNQFADRKGYWADDKLCQGYIMALGVNDLFNSPTPLGSTADVCLEDYTKNAPDTFAGQYAAILQRYRTMMPKSRFFLVTIPRSDNTERNAKAEKHAAFLHELAGMFDYTYVIDLYRDAPVYDAEFRRNFYLGGHLNAAGYALTAKMIASYIDYIVRHQPEDFAQIGFVGTPYHNYTAKW